MRLRNRNRLNRRLNRKYGVAPKPKKIQKEKKSDNKQLQRMKNLEDIHLILFQNNTHFEFLIKGISDEYNVKLNKTTKSLSCTCKDMEWHCVEDNLICKHCCFVLTKVLPFYYRQKDDTLFLNNISSRDNSYFLHTKVFNKTEYNMIVTTLKQKYKSEFGTCDSFRNVCSYIFIMLLYVLFAYVVYLIGSHVYPHIDINKWTTEVLLILENNF
jgi:hypothetical protein